MEPLSSYPEARDISHSGKSRTEAVAEPVGRSPAEMCVRRRACPSAPQLRRWGPTSSNGDVTAAIYALPSENLTAKEESRRVSPSAVLLSDCRESHHGPQQHGAPIRSRPRKSNSEVSSCISGPTTLSAPLQRVAPRSAPDLRLSSPSPSLPEHQESRDGQQCGGLPLLTPFPLRKDVQSEGSRQCLESSMAFTGHEEVRGRPPALANEGMMDYLPRRSGFSASQKEDVTCDWTRSVEAAPMPGDLGAISFSGKRDGQHSVFFPASEHFPASRSCSLARLLQMQLQEDGNNALRVVLQQDAEVWVRHVCDEQRLLQAQLDVAQAKGAALQEELQALRCQLPVVSKVDQVGSENDAGMAASDTVSQPTVPNVEAAKACHDAGFSSSDAPGSPPFLGYSADVVGLAKEPKLDLGTTAMSTAGNAADAGVGISRYMEGLEVYISALTDHTRALQSENQQLQLRLDRRTAQMAASQKRYQQQYAQLLYDQAVLERDYRKATDDVEEVVGLLVVARAAERAAMRRVEECEQALENAIPTAEALETKLRSRGVDAIDGRYHADAAGSGGHDPRNNSGHTNDDPTALDSQRFYSPEMVSGHASNAPSSSAFTSFVEGGTVAVDAAGRWEGVSPGTTPRREILAATGDVSAASSFGIQPQYRVTPLLHGCHLRRSTECMATPLRNRNTRGHSAFEGVLPSPGTPLSAKPQQTSGAEAVMAECGVMTAVGKQNEELRDGVGSQKPLQSHPWTPAAPPTVKSLPLSDILACETAARAADASRASTASKLKTTEAIAPENPRRLTQTSEDPNKDYDEVSNSAVAAAGPTNTKTSLFTPLISSAVALLTPRSLARRRQTVRRQLTAMMADHGNDAEANGAEHRNTLSEEELLRFRCTLLELELQSKEYAYKADRDAWETTWRSAEGVAGVMGEVDARVRHAAASSEKLKGLFHEMSRLWTNSLALEEGDDGSDDDDGDDTGTAAAAALAIMDDEQRRLRRSCEATPLYGWRQYGFQYEGSDNP